MAPARSAILRLATKETSSVTGACLPFFSSNPVRASNLWLCYGRSDSRGDASSPNRQGARRDSLRSVSHGILFVHRVLGKSRQRLVGMVGPEEFLHPLPSPGVILEELTEG
jgi:hypothetical protein